MDLTPEITLPYGFGYLFDPIFEQTGDICWQVYDTMTIFTYVLAYMGLLISALKMQMAGDFSGLGTQLFSTMVVSVLLNFIPDWFIEAQSFLGFTLLDNMDIDIGLIASTYVAETAVWIGIELAAAITASCCATRAPTALPAISSRRSTPASAGPSVSGRSKSQSRTRTPRAAHSLSRAGSRTSATTFSAPIRAASSPIVIAPSCPVAPVSA